jgi:hypothetical protein
VKSPRTIRGHEHIVQVGLGSGNHYNQRIGVSQVYVLMNQGNRFFTVSPSTGRRAVVEPWHCCGIATLRTRPDIVADNNLDNLDACQV